MADNRLTLEKQICDIILGMKRPFEISQLFSEAYKHNITNKDLILDVLSQLCESGVIRYSEIKDNTWAYTLTLQHA